MTPSPTPHSQTLDRGLRLLEYLADGQKDLTITQIAEGLGLHRSIVYRILRTLEDHRLVARTSAGAYRLGPGLAVLARGVSPDLQAIALPELSELANTVGMTAFVVVPDGFDAVTLVSVPPRHSQGHFAQHPGTRHPLESGAPGLALLAGGPPRPGERKEVTEGRRRGWVRSRGEVVPGLTAVAAPVMHRGVPVASVAVVFAGKADEPTVARRVMETAREIAAELP
jgi:DNA-binding IclR family transcriptional regulator